MMLVKLTDVCDFQGGTQPPKSEWTDESKSGYVRMLQIRDFTQQHKDFTEYVKDKSTLKKCTTDDILIGRYGASIGKICKGLEGAYNVALIKTIPDKSVLTPTFLFYILKSESFQSFIKNIGSRAAQAGFNKDDLSNFQIPLPPLEQQQKIASILDAADTLKQKDKALLAKYDELTQALFLDMFGDPVSNPKGWKLYTLSEFIKNLNTGVSVNSTEKDFQTGDIGILKTSCVYTGSFRPNEAKVIRDDEFTRMKLNPIPDSIIISRMNTSELVGKSAYVTNYYPKLYLPDRLWLTEKGSLPHNVRWLSYTLSLQSFMNEISKISSGTSGSMKNISKKSFLKLFMIYPPFELQTQFAERVAIIEQQKAQAQASLEKSEELFNSLLQKAFKGELE